MTVVGETAPNETLVHVVPLNDMPRATARRQLSHDSTSSAKRAVRTFARATTRKTPAPANALSRGAAAADWEQEAGRRAEEDEADSLDWTLCDERASRTGSERTVRRRDSLKKAARRFASFGGGRDAQAAGSADGSSGAGKKTGAVLRAVGRGFVRCGEAWAMWGMMTPARHRAWTPERG